MDHAYILQNLWLVGAIALGGGAFASQAAGVLHGDLTFGLKMMIALGVAAIIFGTMWFFAPAHT